MLPFVWVTILARRRKGETWWLYCGRRILANNKDMVAREGLELPPAAFSGAALWGELAAPFMLRSSYCRSKAITLCTILTHVPFCARENMLKICENSGH